MSCYRPGNAIGIALAAVWLALAAPMAVARGGGHSSGRASHVSRSSSGNHHKAEGVARERHGRIARSEKARDAFMRSHPCPSTGRRSGACPGYEIDHVQALKHGGADAPYNMQWQTTAAAKEKDKWE